MTDRKPLVFDRLAPVQFKVSKESRTIKGLAVPYDVVGDNGFGKYRFTKGTLEWSKVKFLKDHDWTKACGNVDFEDTDEGLLMTAKIAKGALGDEILALSEPDEDGRAVYDGLSIGLGWDAKFEEDDDGVFNCVTATVLETSGTPIPAFTDAQVRSVAASAAQNKENTMKCTKCGVVHAAGVTECEAPAAGAASFSKEDGVKLQADVTALTHKIAELEKVKIPVGPGTATFEVNEEPIYRFSGTTPAPSGFDFATDLLAAGKDGDQAALERLKKFTAEHLGPQFVTSSNVSTVNPSQYRPDMFLGQAPVPASPLYDTFHKGSLDNVTPFFWSKLDRAATTAGVADHVEGTEPAATNLVTVAGATVTPVPVSGRVHITREVADQGGNPVVSGLVWSEFDRSFKIALETKTAALITAAMAGITALATITTGTSGLNSGNAVEAGLVDLQFIPDGFRFTRGFGHVDLYKALAGAVLTTTGEKVYPIINPSNRDGETGDKFAYIDIAGYRMYPAASLGVTGGTKNSLVADPNAVHVWNSGLHRLDKLQEKVEGWDMGVFAYFAGIVYDTSGLRKITYTP